MQEVCFQYQYSIFDIQYCSACKLVIHIFVLVLDKCDKKINATFRCFSNLRAVLIVVLVFRVMDI